MLEITAGQSMPQKQREGLIDYVLGLDEEEREVAVQCLPTLTLFRELERRIAMYEGTQERLYNILVGKE